MAANRGRGAELRGVAASRGRGGGAAGAWPRRPPVARILPLSSPGGGRRPVVPPLGSRPPRRPESTLDVGRSGRRSASSGPGSPRTTTNVNTRRIRPAGCRRWSAALGGLGLGLGEGVGPGLRSGAARDKTRRNSRVWSVTGRRAAIRRRFRPGSCTGTSARTDRGAPDPTIGAAQVVFWHPGARIGAPAARRPPNRSLSAPDGRSQVSRMSSGPLRGSRCAQIDRRAPPRRLVRAVEPASAVDSG